MISFRFGQEARVVMRLETHYRIDHKCNKTPLFCDNVLKLDEFSRFAEELSYLCCAPHQTVTKKVPSSTPKDVEESTYKTFLSYQKSCHEFNNLVIKNMDAVRKSCGYELPQLIPERYSDGMKPGECLETIFSDDAMETLRWARVVIANALNVRFRKSNQFGMGPGVAKCELEHSANQLDKIGQVGSWLIPGNPRLRSVIPEIFGTKLAGYLAEEKLVSEFTEPADLMQVPKAKDKNRTIMVSSSLSIAAGAVLEKHLVKCLKRIGVDLTTLPEHHKDLAYVGSVNGSIQTIDFSSASDTLSIGLITLLFNYEGAPRHVKDFFRLMWSVRNTQYRYGTVIEFIESMFLMGENPTFPLETGVFKSLAIGSTIMCNVWHGLKFASSFGDDMIVHRDVRYSHLGEFGLYINVDKTFPTKSDPYFRESCGADYRCGNYKRGFYVQTRRPTVQDFLRCVNFFKVQYDLQDACLWNIPYFRKVYFKYKLNRISWGIERFVISAIKHRNRIPDYVLLTDVDRPSHHGRFFRVYTCVKTNLGQTSQGGWLEFNNTCQDALLWLVGSEDQLDHSSTNGCHLFSRPVTAFNASQIRESQWKSLQDGGLNNISALPNIGKGISRYRLVKSKQLVTGSYDVTTFFDLTI